jgi:hypothetical protein
MFANSVSFFHILCTLVYTEILFDEGLMVTKANAM